MSDEKHVLSYDAAAREIALRHWESPECLHAPTAAVDESAITTYIGEIEQVLAGGLAAQGNAGQGKGAARYRHAVSNLGFPCLRSLARAAQVWVHIG